MKKKKKLSVILKSKKFFIFMKNHSLHSKYETKLKSLGAIISPFLDKEVNYVLTDSPGCNGKISVTADTLNALSPCYSVSPATSVSGDDCPTTKKTRTRAEAMLERIPVQTQVASSLNPIANAVSWNIPIYSIEFFQKWLDKKLTQIQLVNDNSDLRNESNCRIFEKKYLKLESVLVNQYRPEFKEVSKWPCIDTNTLAGSCPFDRKILKKSRKKENADKKKESERMNRTCNKTANEAGYCEICALHYSDLSQHLSSNSHVKFTANEKNYADLDSCIKTRSVDAFLSAHNSSGHNSQAKESNSNELMGRNLRRSVSLHLNNNNENSAVTRSLSNAKLLADESLKQPLQVQCNGFTNYHLRKTPAKSDSALIRSPGYYGSKGLLKESRKTFASCPEGVTTNKEHLQLSPAKEENVHRLRSRKSLFLPSILIGTTAEDGPNKTRAGISPQTPTSNHFLRSSVSPKSQAAHYATRSRIPSAGDDEKKTCKGDLGNTSIYFTRSKLSCVSPDECEKKNSRSSVSPREENLVNGRQSKRRLSAISDEDERAGCPESPRNVPSYQTSRKTLKNNICNEASLSSHVDKAQKKRLSYEEKFLEDNREYYKVEMLRTKLRSTEFYCNQEINQTVPPKADPEPVAEPAKNDDPDQPVVMRFKKIKQRKQSALNLLNLEAENFLFGPPKREDDEESSDEEDEKDDCDNDVDEKNESPEKKTNDECKKMSNKMNRRSNAKKRRTHAEVFIHDNLDYYRFEISGSRLRHQNAEDAEVLVKHEPEDKSNAITSMPSCSTSGMVRVKEETFTDEESELSLPLKKRGKNRRKMVNENEKDGSTDQIVEKKESTNEDCPAVENTCCTQTVPAESISFSFESVPSSEPWYKTFERYDSCKEFHIPISNNYYAKLQKVPNKNTSARATSTPHEIAASPLNRRKKRSRISRIIAEDKPRKSPRCHASTLAILSSLTNHRRRSKKMYSIETRKSHVEKSIRSEPKTPTPAAVDTNLQYEARLKEAVNLLAKDVDDHFIELFGNEDCRDKYLDMLKNKDRKVPEDQDLISDNEIESHCCMQLDEEILKDEDFLKCFVGSTSEAITEDMASFMDSAQRCSSMETAQDEESAIPRCNDLLSRLWRENDYSCNSSDCGASSTCEFLGFAEDGRTVSRKRKRKRPNMTGWPHSNRRRRNIRFSEINQRNIETNGNRDTEASSSRVSLPDGDNENISEADSECTDDDMPLSQIVSRKKRRINSSVEDGANITRKEQTNETTNEDTNRVSLRRSNKIGRIASALSHNRKSSQNQCKTRARRRRYT